MSKLRRAHLSRDAVLQHRSPTILEAIGLPLHHWTFDDVLTDEHDAGYTWVAGTGSASYNNGVFGKALQIAPGSSSDYKITGKTVPGADGGGSFTMSLWYQPINTGIFQFYRLIEPAVATKVELVHNWSNNKTDLTIHDDGSPGIVRAEAAVLMGDMLEWNFIVAVWDNPTDGLTLYLGLDGEDFIVTAGTPQFGWNGTRDILNTVDLETGANFSLQGNIDDFRIYDFALAEVQVEALYEEGKTALGI